MKKSFGFTLIELLVVVAIISIIMSITLGSIVESRKSARDAKRITDIKSITNGLALYAASNEGAYPASASSCNTSDWTALGTELSEAFPDGLPIDPVNDGGRCYQYILAPGNVCGAPNPAYAIYFAAERTAFNLPTYGADSNFFCFTP